MPYQVRCFSSITQLGRAQWDSVWPPGNEGYGFYLAQEEAGIEGFEFFYLGLYAGERLALVAPLFATPFNMGLAMSDGAREQLQRLQKHWPGLLVFKTLFCGAPTSEKGAIGIHPDFARDPALFELFDQALLEQARRRGSFMIVFKDFMDADLEPLAPLKARGYFIGDSLPTATLDIAFDSTEAYLATLSTGTRKDVKRKLKATDKDGRLEIEAARDIGHCIGEAYQLYRNVHDNGPMHFELLTPAYFLNFARDLPDQAVYFLYWLKDGAGRRLVGMNFCLQFQDRLVDKFIGMDYAVSRDLNLYFVSFINNVRWCIDHGLKTYVLSQGGYPVKIRLGAQLVPLRTMTRMVNPVVNWFANRFA